MIYRLPAKSHKLAVFGDVHIGIHDEGAMKVLIECFEREGCDVVVANGDIHDCAAVSPHLGKRKRAALESGQLAEEAASGRWIVDWCATRPCLYGVGNHEDWVNDLALDTNTVGTVSVTSALGLPEGPDFRVLPHGYQIRFGSLVLEHGDVIFARSSGSQHLAANILRRYPNQTTVVNHFHHQDYAVSTTNDSDGLPNSHACYALGHVSQPDAHQEYAGRNPNWQQGGAIIETFTIDNKPRFSVHLIEVHRDKRGRPWAQFNGHVYR